MHKTYLLILSFSLISASTDQPSTAAGAPAEKPPVKSWGQWASTWALKAAGAALSYPIMMTLTNLFHELGHFTIYKVSFPHREVKIVSERTKILGLPIPDTTYAWLTLREENSWGYKLGLMAGPLTQIASSWILWSMLKRLEKYLAENNSAQSKKNKTIRKIVKGIKYSIPIRLFRSKLSLDPYDEASDMGQLIKLFSKKDN